MTTIPDRCTAGARALDEGEIRGLADELHADWQVHETRSIQRTFKAKDFADALAMLGEIGRIAEEQDHHPDLAIRDYRTLTITLSTHDAGGLSANDFVVAQLADAVLSRSA